MSSRRRLRIVCSSDEEEEDDDDVVQEAQPPLHQHDDISISNPNNNNNPSLPIQIEISDEEFIDATEDLSNSPPQPQHQTVYSSEYSTTTSDTPINRVLGDLGLRLKSEWLDSCLRGLQTALPGFSNLDDTKKAKLCFEKFLHADMNYCGAGVLPNNVHQMHLVDLPGPFVLQVDEIVNISQHLRERYKKANSGLKRCLKLSMTDGVQRVFGMEYQPIKDLDTLAPAGLKVAISNVNVRHGLIMLVPEVFQVLGGIVEELDAARQRLVTEVNKPPRGRRTRTGVVPSLATRATRAAWPANDPVSQSTTPMQGDNTVSVNGRASSNSAVPVNVSSSSEVPINGRGSSSSAVSVNGRVSSNSAVPVDGRVSSNSAVPFDGRVSPNSPVPVDGRVSSNSAVPVDGRVSSNSAVPVDGRVSSNSAVSVDGRVSSNSAVPVDGRVSSNSAVPVDGRVSSNSAVPVDFRVSSNSAVPVSVRVSSNSAVPVSGSGSSNSAVPVDGSVSNSAVPDGHQPPRTGVDSSFFNHRMNTEPFPSTTTTENSVNMNMDSFAVPLIRGTVETIPFRVREETTAPIHLESPVVFSDDENVHLVDRSSENPFTYLVNLSVKWAASKDKASHVEGKIKCFVTGVKEFQFKKRSTYSLQVYIDDGSLISEILIDHNIVQKKIGYSPEEINAALSSSDPSRVQDMRNIMKQFQVYLVNFEGTMVVRISEASILPVAIEMQQGCSLSDAWSLLGRLKSSNDDQRSQLDPIILSP